MRTDETRKHKMMPAICTQCGAQIEVDLSNEIATCKFCGNTFIVEKAIQNYSVQNANIQRVDSMNINKRGAVESILSFVESQQERKQKKFDEEQKQREKDEIRNRKQLPWLIAGVVIPILILMGMSLFDGGAENIKQINVPESSSDLKGDNYQDVVKKLEDAGFTNIKTTKLGDLVTGWLTKEGEVETVEINSISSFNTDTDFPIDSAVIITYHTLPIEKENDNTPVASETSEKPANAMTEASGEEILTPENNGELAALLAVKDPADSIVGKFAKDYDGRIIKFDGNIANMMNHENYKTRYDILMYAGDYSETKVIGPNFKFEDANVFDLKLSGSNIPDNISQGLNLHIMAKVAGYNEVQEIFFLKPISIEIR